MRKIAASAKYLDQGIAKSQTSRNWSGFNRFGASPEYDVSLLGTHSNAHKLVTTHKHHPLYPHWSFSAERGRSAIDEEKDTITFSRLSRVRYHRKCIRVTTARFAYGAGMISSWPGRSRSGFCNEFASMICWIVTPNCSAMPLSVSPSCTTCF